MMLSLEEHQFITNRLEKHLPQIERSALTERQKLQHIGHIVEVARIDFQEIIKEKRSSPANPSSVSISIDLDHNTSPPIEDISLLTPDDITITEMARWQKKLRHTDLSEQERSQKMQELLQFCLNIQKENRT